MVNYCAHTSCRTTEPCRYEPYPRPWRLSYRLAWFVVDARDGIVAGGFGSIADASQWLDANEPAR